MQNLFKKWYSLLVSYLINGETKFLRSIRPYYITYFIFEYLYETDEKIKEVADSRTVNNRYVERIEGHNKEIYYETDFARYFDNSTFIYKLSYKMNLPTSIDGQLTPLGKLLELKGVEFNG